MNEAALEAEATPVPIGRTPGTYPYHRDCVKCGYDLFGQPLVGVCPECAASLLETVQRPLWTVTHAKALARSRWAFLLAAIAFLLILAFVGAASAASVLVAPAHPAFVTVNVALAATALVIGATLLTALVVMGFGVGGPAWRRWAPLGFSLATVLWVVLGRSAFPPGRLSVAGLAVSATLLWAAGLSMQSAAVAIAYGLPQRAAAVRAKRAFVMTRLLLLTPVVATWGVVSFLAMKEEMDSWTHLKATDLANYCIVGALPLWMFLVAGHWVRLVRFMRTPRTLAS